MQIALGQSVLSSDGRKIGTIDRVLLNPVDNHVEHFIVHRGLFLDQDKMVSRGVVERVDAAGVHITLDSAAAKQLPRYEHSFDAGEMSGGYPEVIPGSLQSMILFSTPPAGKTYLDHGSLFELSPLEGTEERPELPGASDAVIGKGADVIGSDGMRVGYVHEVEYGEDGTLEAVVVQFGLIRHQRVAISSEQIAEIDDEEIVLKVPGASFSPPGK